MYLYVKAINVAYTLYFIIYYIRSYHNSVNWTYKAKNVQINF